MKTPYKIIAVSCAATLFAACSSDNNNGGGNNSVSTFFEAEASSNFEINTADENTCFDIESNAVVTCDTEAWDIALIDGEFALNGGDSGTGEAAGYGPLTAAELEEYPDSSELTPYQFTQDLFSGLFGNSPWQSYAVNATDSVTDHGIYPNFRVYLIDTDTTTDTDDIIKLQITNYYSSEGASGHISIRYLNLDETSGEIEIDYINASSYDDFVYIDLTADNKNDAIVSETDTWHISLKRYNVQLGDNVAAALGDSQDEFYDEEGLPIPATFNAANAANQLQSLYNVTDDTDLDYVSDELKTVIYGFNGWYLYDFTTHVVSPNTDGNWIIKSSDGSSYSILSATSTTAYPDRSITVNFGFRREITE
jgi:hypothetical protein